MFAKQRSKSAKGSRKKDQNDRNGHVIVISKKAQEERSKSAPRNTQNEQFLFDDDSSVFPADFDTKGISIPGKAKSQKSQPTGDKNFSKSVLCFSCASPFTIDSLPFHLQWCILKRQTSLGYLPENMRPPPSPAPTLPLPSESSPEMDFIAFNQECTTIYRAHLPQCPECNVLLISSGEILCA